MRQSFYEKNNFFQTLKLFPLFCFLCITFTIEYHEETYDYWYENAEGDLYHAWVSYETGYFSDDGKNFIYPPSEKYNEVFFIAKAEDCD